VADTPSAAPILIERLADGAVRVITLNEPERRNALSDRMLVLLTAALTDADLDPDVRCLVVAGSDKVFAAGGDVAALSQRTPMQIYDGDRSRHWEVIRGVRTPLVAAISGLCLGGGLELAMSADVAVASRTARFGLPETSLGLIPAAGGTQMLPRLVGRALAMDMVLTGRLLSAEEAEARGLVSRVVDPDRWVDAAVNLATEIAARPAVAQRLAKESIRAAYETGLQAGIAAERKAFGMAFGSDDAGEGMRAFLDKRPPEWQHR
jgi:enoyl-CoA hydratase